LALDHNLKTIAFPSISTGIYRCPIEECSRIAVEEVRKFTEINPGIEEVRFILFSEKDYQVYEKALKD
jgi:O-acetyl-ADP-ribose deacetylase (regulator of RNase III)